MNFIHILLVATLLLFSACASKKEYFEPKEIYGKKAYNYTLSSEIKDVTRKGATLKNGQIITEEGLSNIKIEKDFVFLGKFDDKYTIANASGEVKLLDENAKVLYEKSFSRTIVSMGLKGSILALVDSSNTLYLVDIRRDEIYFSNKQDSTSAHNSKIASPIFLDTLVIFPTLDGKLVIVDWRNARKVKDVVISDEEFFNNIMYLEIINNKLLAATQTRAIYITPENEAHFDAHIKDLLHTNENIYILTNDGQVLLLDENLNVQKSKKFIFAMFLANTIDEKLFLLERNGHIIEMDLNLNNSKIYKLPNPIKDLVYMTKDTLFYKDQYMKFYK